ncbi:tRNA lysidine(34) synthetase TilS [Blastopirellula marina]|nr:tRNA lysidine(34) synthetase TilS [Blastopirellula marina]
MSDLPQRLLDYWPRSAWQDRTILVAVSGGADSVALVRLLVELADPATRKKLVVVHFNHRLRGEQSDADAQFVEDLAKGLGVSVRTGIASGGWHRDAKGGQGLEANARGLRYAFFEEVAREVEARYLVTAHHRDDQIETILHRILRGTGIAGLGGMQTAREWLPGVGLVRPLLSFSRDDIIEYLVSIKQVWREDASNLTIEFTRNRIRNELLPYLRDAYGEHVDNALFRLGQQARDCQEVIDRQVQTLLDLAVQTSTFGRSVVVRKLADVPPYLVRELFVRIWDEQNWPRQEMTQLHWQRLSNLAKSDDPTATDTLPGDIRAMRDGDVLILRSV